MLKKNFLQTKRKGTKKCPFFSFASSNSYMTWSARLVSLKVCVGFSIINFLLFLLKFKFLFNKNHGRFDIETSYFLSKTHTFTPRPQITKLQQNVLKFNDILLSWSSLHLENRNFENVSFSQ